MTSLILDRHIGTDQWAITLDGKFYRVTRRIMTDHYHGHGAKAESKVWIDWRVFAQRGVHGERECDETKPTFKRVVEAVEDAFPTRTNCVP